jgi:hypothetical protein
MTIKMNPANRIEPGAQVKIRPYCSTDSLFVEPWLNMNMPIVLILIACQAGVFFFPGKPLEAQPVLHSTVRTLHYRQLDSTDPRGGDGLSCDYSTLYRAFPNKTQGYWFLQYGTAWMLERIDGWQYAGSTMVADRDKKYEQKQPTNACYGFTT